MHTCMYIYACLFFSPYRYRARDCGPARMYVRCYVHLHLYLFATAHYHDSVHYYLNTAVFITCSIGNTLTHCPIGSSKY